MTRKKYVWVKMGMAFVVRYTLDQRLLETNKEKKAKSAWR